VSVDEFLDDLAHPRRAEIDALRAVIRSTDARLTESVKWNAPNFALADVDTGAAADFATLNLRPPTQVRVVLHTGAKVRPGHPELVVDDPEGLLRWLGKDRAIVTFTDLDDIEAKRPAFEAILRAWIAQLAPDGRPGH